MIRRLFLLITFFFFCHYSYSQCPAAFPVDLTASSNAVYSQSYSTIGPLISNCCPSFSSDGNRCIRFSVTLNPGAMGIRFEMNPIPSFGVYRIDCGSASTNVGSFVCLSGQGPHILTFCNPAIITALFTITSVPRPTAGPNISISQGCSKIINATGFSTATWNSIPNNPAYNNYLSCNNCLNPTITPGASPPPYVDYQVCGTPAVNGCGSLCDTIRAFFTPPLSVIITPPNPTICNGQTPNSTSIAATGSGGSGSYTYLWNNINPSQNITVPNGLYTVVLSDGTGCNATASTVVKTFSVPVSTNAGPDQTVCKQTPITTLNGSVTGANGGIWTGGAGVFSPNNSTLTATYAPTALELAAGYVDLTLNTTGNGTCAPGSDIVRINYVVFTGVVGVSASLVSCYGATDGGITVSIVGGVPPFSYSWNTSPAQTTATAISLGIGNYTVTITNGIGCTSTTSATVIQPPPIVLASSITHVSCYGGNNGSIAITPSGGIGPYTYLWQPGNQTAQTIAGQAAGTYTVTVKDSKGCQSTSTYTINQPPAMTISLTATPVSCFGGSNGTASSTLSGGNSPYSFNWSSGATSPNTTGLHAGSVTLTVTDNLGCLASNSVVISQPAAIIVSTTSTNETCNYLNDGSSTAIASGGNPGYTYLWQPGALTSANISNLSSGTYTLTVTDVASCSTTAFSTINEPTPLTINFISQVNVSCYAGNDGLVTASPVGGTPNYTYLWASGGGTASGRNNLQAGTYSVTVTDSKGCTSTNSVIITQPVAALAINPTITNVPCNAGNNGSISIASSGGTSPYTYLWQPGNQTNQQINGIGAGTYSVTVKDAKGCQIINNYTVTQPPPTIISITPTPVSCMNGSDGTANSSVSGGTSPFTYSWMPGSLTTNTISNLTAGTYTLTLLDFKGCSTTSPVTIIQPLPITLNSTITHIVCSGGNSGAVSIVPSGGTAPYAYLWSQGNQTTSSINNLSIGTYTVTVTDSKSCQITSNYTVNQLTLTIALTATNVKCFGGNNGTISALPSGGTPNFSYNWLPGGSTTNAISNLTAGTYTLSVTDSKGCIAKDSVEITQPIAVSASATSTNETCNYLNNGTATASPSGGIPGYTYLWQPALQTTGTISNLSAGTYTLTVSDSRGCTAITSAIITQPNPLTISFTGQANVSTCFGDNNGAVTGIASGGTPNYTYSWMPGSLTTNAISNLTAGTYTLTLQDINGCIATNPTVITQPTAVTASITKTNETCSYLNNGTATVTGLGGSPGYTYLWQPGALTTSNVTNLSAGTYTATVTDLKGCAVNVQAIITEPALLAVNFTGQVNESCFGGNDGKVSLSPSGGTANYIYSWAPGGATTAHGVNLTAGLYTITITDSKGCTGTNSVNISEPTVVSAGTTSINETCNYLNNGTATAIPAGGTPGYNYLWKPGLQTTGTVSNLSAGTYTLIVTDSKGCTGTTTTTITEPVILAISFSSQINVTTCFGDNNGSVTATPSGGTPNYTYSWMPGSATTASISSLTAGTYTLTLLDNLGCTAIKTVAISQPTLLSASILKTDETCNYLNNGTAAVTLSGGTPGSGYTYLWQPGALTSNTISGLSAGTYTATGTDSKGCIATALAIITEPATLAVNFSGQVNVSCFGGSDGTVSSVPSGGTANYTYSWAPGGSTTANRSNLAAGTHTLTITDSKGCTATNTVLITEPTLLSASTTNINEICSYSTNASATAIPLGGTPAYTYSWQPGFQTTVTKTGLSSGTYTVTVKDSKGCIATALATITGPPVLAINFTGQTNVSCKDGNNGSVTASPSGGTSGYTYSWTPGGATTASRTNLTAGTYSVTVTDSKGCVATKSVTITQPTLLLVSTTKTDETCSYLNNGTAAAISSGGTSGYIYLWQPGALTTSNVTNLSAGTYTVTATDSKGCTATAVAIITEPAPVIVSFSSVINASCFGGNQGGVAASGSGGTLNYTYSWSPGAQTTNAISNLTAGTYSVTITDSKGCSATNTVVIAEPAPLAVSSSFVPPTCFNKADGSISAFGSGGTFPYSYSWITPTPASIGGQTITNTLAGTYVVRVSDAKGCHSDSSFILNQPAQIIISHTTVNSGCNIATGSATVSITGGVPSFTYLWSTGGTNNTIINLASSVYSVVVTDANGCKSSQYIDVIDDSAAVPTISLTMPSCFNGSDGIATVSTTGGIGTFSYLWSPTGDTGITASGLSTGTYTVKVTTSPNDCKSYATDSLYQPTPILLLGDRTNVSCFGGSDGTAWAGTLGGTPGYTYQWMPGGMTGSSIINFAATTYTVQVTDSKGCTKTIPITISQPAAPISVSISSFTPVSCFGGADGAASASSATGGNGGAYQYNWMPGNINGKNASTLTAGTYTVTAKDYKGCTGTAIVIITEPPLLTLSFINQTNVSCFGGNNGSITVSHLGGTPGFTYLWKPGGETTTSISNLKAGKDSITAVDLNGCIATNYATITQPTVLLANSSKTNETCDYLNNGTASSIPSGGIAPYSFLWQPGSITTASLLNLSSGTYSLTVTDSLGCIANVTAVITEPSLLGITFSGHVNVSCFAGNDGAISASASGGTAVFFYSWMPGAITTSSLSNLTIGTYTLTVKDINNCLAQSPVTITQPVAALSATVSSTPVSCFGGANGSVSSLATGGTGPYNYKWMPGNLIGPHPINISAKTYTVTITDSKGCVFIDSATVTQPTSIALTTSSINSNCSLPNGQASVSASGGTGLYLYQWLPSGGTNANANALLAGTYTVTITDGNGCLFPATVSVSDNTSPVAIVSSTTNVSCNGGSDGTATVTVTGIASGPPYTYSWLPSGGTNITATGLSPGTYTVTVTDTHLCQSIPAISPVITEPPPIIITVNKTSVNCFGGNDGGASASVIGGTPGYTYLWLPGISSGTSITNLSATTYTVQITDTHSCIQTSPFTIISPPAALSVSLSSTPVSCFGGGDGSTSSIASGGIAPYDYSWMPGNYNAQNLYNLPKGTYTVTVVDSKGCTVIDSITVTQPTLLSLAQQSINSNCSFANGQASVSVSGGTLPYLYQWSPTGGTNSVATALLSGLYTISVTDSNECLSTMAVTVNDNPGPLASISAMSNVNCFGGSDGTISLTVSGTSGPFTYSWLPSGGTNSTATGLLPGTYTVTVSDTNLCQSPPVISPEITEPSPIYVIVATNPVTCNGGNNGDASAIVSGGTPGYSYQWLPGGTTGTSINNLSGNTYSVLVTDANSCTQTKNFTISEPPIALSVSLSSRPVSCFGGANGSVTSIAAGGTSPYNYFWMPGNLNGQNQSNLTIGTYTVSVKDSKGCTIIDSVKIVQPNLIVLTKSSINSNCSLANGQASVSVSGGILPYAYQWTPSGETNAVASALLSGTYTVSVTDSNACISTTVVTVNDNPSPTVIVSSVTNVSCNGGSDGTASATVSGTSGPFTYSWSPSGGINSIGTGMLPGTYTVIATDTNLCQSAPATSPIITEPSPIIITVATSTMSCFGGSNETASASASGGMPAYTYQWLPSGSTGSSIANLSANTYTIAVTDANNCLQTQPFTITSPSKILTSISSSTNVSCFGLNNGAATVSVSGGSPVYSYNWLPAGGNGPTGSGLSAKTYTVNITDSKGCTAFDSVIITQPSILSATAAIHPITCFGANDGSASIHPVGGTSGYSYQWNPAVSINDTVSGLSPGNYNIIISDTNSCQTNLSIAFSQPATLSGILITVNPSCGLTNGSISTQLSGGTYPYTYLWSPGGFSTFGINGLAQGTYSVQINDAFNCSLSLSATINNVPIPILAVASINPVSCFGGNDGSATVSISQGTAPYNISWSPTVPNNLTATSLTSGTYTITITDADGCQKSDSALINEPTPIDLSSLTVSNVLCYGGSTGSISVSPTGGIGPLYTYSWAPIISSSPTIANLSIGTYTLNVTDQNSCIVSTTINITQPTLLTSTIDSIQNPACFNGFGGASVFASGGTLPYNYSWAPSGDPISTAHNLSAGTYTVITTDANGCATNNTVILTQPSQVVTTGGINDTLCLGQTGALSAIAAGGAGNYYYAWQPSGAITSGILPITPISDITYTIVAYDQNGCAGTPANANAIVYTLNNSSLQAFATSPICPGQSSVVYVETYGNTGVLSYQWNNNLGTGPGVYLVTPQQPTTYIVTVSNVCSSVNDTVDILFNPPPTISFTSDTSALCVPGTIRFFDNSVTGNPNDPITMWDWSFGDGTTSTDMNPAHSYTSPFTYPVTLTIITSGGCTNNNLSTPLIINGHPFPNAAFSVNSTDLNLPYDILTCSNQSTGTNTYNWSFGDGETSSLTNPQHLYTSINIFQVQLIAMTDFGCLDTATTEVTTNADVVFPNAFTPNFDGPSGGSYDINSLDNNVFFPYTSGVVEYKLEIYNRWGEKIFETQNIKQGWDGYYKGQLCQQDVYIWKAYIKLNNGKIIDKSGNLTLLQ